jgi:hypothetical protein
MHVRETFEVTAQNYESNRRLIENITERVWLFSSTFEMAKTFSYNLAQAIAQQNLIHSYLIAFSNDILC